MRISYTPEYAGHTIFYIFTKKPHLFFNHLQNSTVDLSYQINYDNITFGDQISTIQKQLFPFDVLYSIEMFDISLELENPEEFEKNIKSIINFNSIIQQDIQCLKELPKELNSDIRFKAIFPFNSTKFYFQSTKVNNSILLNIEIKISDFNVYNAISMIISMFNCKNYTLSQKTLLFEDYFTKIQKGDLMTTATRHPTVFHNTTILYWKETMYHKLIFVQNPKLGRGLIVDNIAQYFENSFNYTDFFYSKIDSLKPKKILIFGSDLSIIVKLQNSDIFKNIEKIILVEIDKEMIELSKKILFQLEENFFNDKKIEIIIKDPYQYIVDLDKNLKFDLIIEDILSSDENPEMFLKMKDFHLSQEGEILTNSGFITLEGDYPVHQSAYPNYLKNLFKIQTIAIYTPISTGHTIFYILKLKKNRKLKNLF